MRWIRRGSFGSFCNRASSAYMSATLASSLGTSPRALAPANLRCSRLTSCSEKQKNSLRLRRVRDSVQAIAEVACPAPVFFQTLSSRKSPLSRPRMSGTLGGAARHEFRQEDGPGRRDRLRRADRPRRGLPVPKGSGTARTSPPRRSGRAVRRRWRDLEKSCVWDRFRRLWR